MLPIDNFPTDIYSEISIYICKLPIFHLQRYMRTNMGRFATYSKILEERREDNTLYYKKADKLYFEFWQAGNVDADWETKFISDETKSGKRLGKKSSLISRIDWFSDRDQRNQLHAIVKFGDFSILKKLIHCGKIGTDEIINAERLDVARQGIESRILQFSKKYVDSATEKGNMAFLQWAAERRKKTRSDKTKKEIDESWDVRLAVHSGYVDVAKFVYEQMGRPELKKNIWFALTTNDLNMANWLQTIIPAKKSKMISSSLYDCAGLDWMLANNVSIDTENITHFVFEMLCGEDNAAEFEKCRAVFKWVQSRGLPFSQHLCPLSISEYDMLLDFGIKCDDDLLYGIDGDIDAEFGLKIMANGHNYDMGTLHQCMLDAGNAECSQQELEANLDKIFDQRDMLRQISLYGAYPENVRKWAARRFEEMK